MPTVTAVILFLLALAVQAWASGLRPFWPGLVLPGLTFLYSLLMVLGAVAFNGEFPWGPILACLLLGNIPTIVLLAIYWAAREKLRVKDQIDKMNIDDL